MCGLIASLVAPNHQALHTDDWFRESLIASQVRGLDSTGIFQLARNGQVYTAKAAQNASTFIRSNSVARGLIVDACKEPLTVGHVRAATQGGVVDANAHPFKVEREDKSYVVGVHNGTLKGWKDKEGGKDQDVDSAWAFNVFAKEGPVTPSSTSMEHSLSFGLTLAFLTMCGWLVTMSVRYTSSCPRMVRRC